MQSGFKFSVFNLLQTSVMIDQNKHSPVSFFSSHSKYSHLCGGWIESQSQPPLDEIALYIFYGSVRNFTSKLVNLYHTNLLYIEFCHSFIYIYMFYWISTFPWATFCIMSSVSINRQWILLKTQNNISDIRHN